MPILMQSSGPNTGFWACWANAFPTELYPQMELGFQMKSPTSNFKISPMHLSDTPGIIKNKMMIMYQSILNISEPSVLKGCLVNWAFIRTVNRMWVHKPGQFEFLILPLWCHCCFQDLHHAQSWGNHLVLVWAPEPTSSQLYAGYGRFPLTQAEKQTKSSPNFTLYYVGL